MADFADRIVSDPNILMGKPVIKGTRISVSFLLNALATMDIDEILEAYPFLTREDVNRLSQEIPPHTSTLKRKQTLILQLICWLRRFLIHTIQLFL